MRLPCHVPAILSRAWTTTTASLSCRGDAYQHKLRSSAQQASVVSPRQCKGLAGALAASSWSAAAASWIPMTSAAQPLHMQTSTPQLTQVPGWLQALQSKLAWCTTHVLDIFTRHMVWKWIAAAHRQWESRRGIPQKFWLGWRCAQLAVTEPRAGVGRSRPRCPAHIPSPSISSVPVPVQISIDMFEQPVVSSGSSEGFRQHKQTNCSLYCRYRGCQVKKSWSFTSCKTTM